MNAQAINESPLKAYITVTGGGTSFIGDFLSTPGGSQTILKFEVPYAPEATTQFLGKEPDRYVSNECALKLAAQSFRKAQELKPLDHVIGIGLTCSLTKAGEREGRKHRVAIASQSLANTRIISGVFKASLDRQVQEQICSDLVYKMLFEEIGLNTKDYQDFFDELFIDSEESGQYQELYSNKPTVINEPPKKCAIFPGSFNPPHAGHKEISRLAEEILDVSVYWEISATNFEKPPLDYLTMRDRQLKIATAGQRLCWSNLTMFNEKVRYFAEKLGSFYFIVGPDTWDRIFHKDFLREAEEFVDLCLENDIKVLIFGDEAEYICDGMNEELWRKATDIIVWSQEAARFKMDVRSSSIRKYER